MSNPHFENYDKDGNVKYSSPYYAIGDLYITTRSENPQIRFGYGIWELFGKGKTLVCVDTSDSDFNIVKKTGGNKAHYHNAGNLIACYDPVNPYNNIVFRKKDIGQVWSLSGHISETRIVNSGGGSSGIGIEVIGNTASASNLPPYITAYFWIRLS